jgi:HSP20 family molecular chaperone IbpA
MRRKLLFILLTILCGLMVFETGYLVGLGSQVSPPQFLYSRHRNTNHPVIYPGRYRAQRDYDIWKDMETMHERMTRMMEPQLLTYQKGNGFLVTAMTSRETKEAFIVTIALPDLNKEAIDVEVNGRMLTVKARQDKESKVNQEPLYKEELSSFNFSQTWTLPESIKVSEIAAEYSGGTLIITIPKDKGEKKPAARQIKIPVK